MLEARENIKGSEKSLRKETCLTPFYHYRALFHELLNASYRTCVPRKTLWEGEVTCPGLPGKLMAEPGLDPS